MSKWMKIRTAYVLGSDNLRQLARDQDVNYETLKYIAQQEDWKGLRQEHRQNQSGLNRAARLLLEQICRAAGELTLYTQVTKVKEKMEGGEKTSEILVTQDGDRVDVKALKELTVALKNIRDICNLWDPMERRELELKLRQAERQLEGAIGANISVKLEGEMEEFAK